MATLGGLDLGDIESENITKQNSVITMPDIPTDLTSESDTGDTSKTCTFQPFKPTRVLEVSGTYCATSLSEVASFITSLNAKANAKAQTYSGETITVSGIVTNIKVNTSVAPMNTARYSFTLLEGKSITDSSCGS